MFCRLKQCGLWVLLCGIGMGAAVEDAAGVELRKIGGEGFEVGSTGRARFLISDEADE